MTPARGEEGDSEVVPEGGEGNPVFLRVRNLPSQVPRLANPTAVIVSACDGDEVSIRRSVVALIAYVVTPRDNGTVGSESDAVKIAARDGDDVGIRRSVALPICSPSDHSASGSTSRQATKRGGVAFVERSYSTERVHCPRSECYGPSRSRERELSSARSASCRWVFVPP